jgi:hypothetical protein
MTPETISLRHQRFDEHVPPLLSRHPGLRSKIFNDAETAMTMYCDRDGSQRHCYELGPTEAFSMFDADDKLSHLPNIAALNIIAHRSELV